MIIEEGVNIMTYISPNEIGKRYDKIANHFECKRSLTLGLNYIDRFLSLLSSESKHHTVLDIGCGTGIPLTKYLISNGAEVTGLDISIEMLKKAKKKMPNENFIRADITKFESNKKYDGILAWDSLFHIPIKKQEKTIKEIIGLLKKKGIFLFTIGGEHGELVSEMFGQQFYYSSLSNSQYEDILVEENCQIIVNELDDPRSKGHRVICCKKWDKSPFYNSSKKI